MNAGLRSVGAVLIAIGFFQLDSAATQKQPPPQQQPSWPDAATLAERKREAERRRLFRSDESLPVTLKADFRAVMRDRNDDSVTTFPATISFPAADGSVQSTIETKMPVSLAPIVANNTMYILHDNGQLTAWR